MTRDGRVSCFARVVGVSKSHTYRLLAERSQPLVWQLRDDEQHHLLKVLRAKAGQQIELTDGRGTWARAVVESLSRQQVDVRVISEHEEPRQDYFHLMIGALKPAAMDELLPPLCELGVGRIVVFGQEGVPTHRMNEKVMQRWQRLIEQSIKQCKRAWLPEISVVDDLAAALAGESTRGLFLDPGSEETLAQKLVTATPVTCVVGGERGLDDHEVEQLVGAGWQSARLGQNILRAVTAAMSAAAVVAAINA